MPKKIRSLYGLSLKTIVTFEGVCFNDSKLIPNVILMDILNSFEHSCRLGYQDYIIFSKLFENFDIFYRFLTFNCYKGNGLMRYVRVWRLFKILRRNLYLDIDEMVCKKISKAYEFQGDLESGIKLGNFLSRTGMFQCAELVFHFCLKRYKQMNESQTLNVFKGLLHSQHMNNKMDKANITFLRIQIYIREHSTNLASVYCSMADYLISVHEYQNAYFYSEKALKELNDYVTEQERIYVYLVCIKTFVLKKKFLCVAFLFKKVSSEFAEIKNWAGNYRNIIFADILIEYMFCLKYEKMSDIYLELITSNLKEFLVKFHFQLFNAKTELLSLIWDLRFNLGFNVSKFLFKISIYIYEEVFGSKNYQVKKLRQKFLRK